MTTKRRQKEVHDREVRRVAQAVAYDVYQEIVGVSAVEDVAQCQLVRRSSGAVQRTSTGINYGHWRSGEVSPRGRDDDIQPCLHKSADGDWDSFGGRRSWRAQRDHMLATISRPARRAHRTAAVSGNWSRRNWKIFQLSFAVNRRSSPSRQPLCVFSVNVHRSSVFATTSRVFGTVCMRTFP